MPLALGLGLSPVLGGGPGFSPSSLFANGEQGGWFDPADLSTLFQVSGVTLVTPVATDGQPVSFALDKHSWGGKTLTQIMAAQPELIPSQDLTTWALINTSGHVSRTPGSYHAESSTDGVAKQSLAAEAPVGAVFQIEAVLNGGGSGGHRIIGWSGVGSTNYALNTNPAPTAPTKYTCIYCNKDAGTSVGVALYGANSTPSDITVGSTSFKRVPGLAAWQPTTSKLPVYKTDGTLSWLLNDGVDDDLPVSYDNLGAACTVAYADGSGAHILTGQTINGSYNLPHGADNKLFGCVIIDRALTAPETAVLTTWLNRRAGL